ncbi:MAG: ComEC/Rec2 family competence protein [Bacteroidales bacterium]|nr:ComEC/Rec2 family competence protein [Bacteroidales bacterium]
MDNRPRLRQLPFIRLLIPYVLGISVLNLFPVLFPILPVTVLITIVLLLFLHLLIKEHQLKNNLNGIVIILLFFNLGLLSLKQAKTYSILPERKVNYTGIICKTPFRKQENLHAECILMSYSTDSIKHNISGKIILYLQPDSLNTLPLVGDSILFTTNLKRINNRGNPKEFDYAGYMGNKRIYYSAFVLTRDYKFRGNSGKYKIKRTAGIVQKAIIDRFKENGIKGDELAVISALVAGERSEISDDLKLDYSVAGATHILAVSGLHVGILYLFLSLLLFRRNNFLPVRLIRLTFILGAIWFFAFITGLSSSVLRASVMFSLFLTGKSFNRPVHSYNILAASAFIILVADPLELFRVGFQFSYLAVFGIIYFQPKISGLLIFRNQLIDWVWQLLSVSVAAQLITFPLSIYYFHQFPVYFWLTNIIIIPAVWLIMIFTIAFFLSFPFGTVTFCLTKVLNVLLTLMNSGVKFISEIPCSSISDIRFEKLNLVYFYLSISLLIYAYTYCRKNFLHVISMLVLIYLVCDIYTYINLERKKEIVIYNAGRFNALSLIDGHKHLVIADSALFTEDSDFIKYTTNFRIYRQVNRLVKYVSIQDVENKKLLKNDFLVVGKSDYGLLIKYYGCNIFFYRKNMTDIINEIWTGDTVNYLVVDNNSGFPDRVLIEDIKPEMIIISPSVSNFLSGTWREEGYNCRALVYDLSENGSLHVVKY